MSSHFFFFAVLGFELRALHLLGRQSTEFTSHSLKHSPLSIVCWWGGGTGEGRATLDRAVSRWEYVYLFLMEPRMSIPFFIHFKGGSPVMTEKGNV
jgi:hypothetical protein